jgi:RNA polymerase sigma-70 factor (ECF subfamily)
LSTYLIDIAKKRAIDRLRSRTASAQRDENYAAAVELHRSNPMEIMEAEIEAHELWKRVEEAVPSERDRQVLKLILAGERSTAALAEALGVPGLSPLEQRREVKQHRDRLMKILDRLGMRLGHDDA